jgi:hypothetical protein
MIENTYKKTSHFVLFFIPLYPIDPKYESQTQLAPYQIQLNIWIVSSKHIKDLINV